MRRDETGLVTDCWGKAGFHLLLLMATTLYVLVAFPWQSEYLHSFTLLSECLFRERSGRHSRYHLENHMSELRASLEPSSGWKGSLDLNYRSRYHKGMAGNSWSDAEAVLTLAPV